MKKWKCSLCGHVYDPEKETPPGEAPGAARCGYDIKVGKRSAGSACVKCGGVMEAYGEKNRCRKGCK